MRARAPWLSSGQPPRHPFYKRSPVAGARSSLGPGIVLLVILVTRLLAIESRMVAFSGTGLAGHVLLRCVKMARITPARLWPHSGSPEVGGEPPAAHQTGQRQAEQSGWAKRSPDPQQLGSQPHRFSRLRDASLLRWEKTFTRPHFPQPHALCRARGVLGRQRAPRWATREGRPLATTGRHRDRRPRRERLPRAQTGACIGLCRLYSLLAPLSS